MFVTRRRCRAVGGHRTALLLRRMVVSVLSCCFDARPLLRRVRLVAVVAVIALAGGCAGPGDVNETLRQAAASQQSGAPAATADSSSPPSTPAEPDPRGPVSVPNDPETNSASTTEDGVDVATPQPAERPVDQDAEQNPETFTIAFAGDVNFAERTADRLAADPATAFGVAAKGLGSADLTMVNLETAITTGGAPEPKSFTFRAPPSAFTALHAAGVDVASMANNHGADYGAVGLADSVAAIAESGFPVIGIGANEAQAMAPYRTTIKNVPIAIFAVSAVHDHTLASWTATADTPGIASAFDPRLAENVRAAAADGTTVIVFLHWGTEYDSCPDSDQVQLADELAAAGASAVIGAHAHVLQGAGWRSDGTYVAYGLSNYLWWRSFGNEQDDNGVLTLTFDGRTVTAASFAPSHLDVTGVPVPATGTQRDRIDAEWEEVRACADLSAQPPT